MDSLRFDALARSFASRRVALGGGISALLSSAGFGQEAEAGCKQAGAKCGHKKCCAGARCRRKRCRCKPGYLSWAGVCCKDRFALANGPGLEPLPGTEFCCAASGVCSQDSDPAHDDCCQEGETCINGKCCCDGCHGTVICGGVCCGSASCCNGVCCGSNQVCAAKSPGVHTCVPATRNCASDAQCFPDETCWGGVCCTAERMCSEYNGPGPATEVCCSVSHYCDASNMCCPNGGDCSTGKKVRIRL